MGRLSPSFQDLKIVDGQLIGSGLLPGRKGVIDCLAVDDFTLLRRVEMGTTSRGVPFTNEGITFRGGRLYLLPEDDPSRLFILTPSRKSEKGQPDLAPSDAPRNPGGH